MFCLLTAVHLKPFMPFMPFTYSVIIMLPWRCGCRISFHPPLKSNVRLYSTSTSDSCRVTLPFGSSLSGTLYLHTCELSSTPFIIATCCALRAATAYHSNLQIPATDDCCFCHAKAAVSDTSDSVFCGVWNFRLCVFLLLPPPPCSRE